MHNKKEQKDDQILDAALTEFLEKGLKAASMHNIATTANVSKRTLYKYYPSKEVLYNHLIDIMLIKIENMYNFDFNLEEEPTIVLKTLLRKKIDLTLEKQFIDISKIVISEMLKGNKPSDADFKRMTESENLFLNWIEKAQELGKIRNDICPQEIANKVHSLLKGEIYWPVLLGMVQVESIDKKSVLEKSITFFSKNYII